MAEDLTPFAFGAIYGTRSWEVNADGMLIGPVYPQVWTPGENVAGCCMVEDHTPARDASYRPHTRRLQPPGMRIVPGHMKNHKCGFYAYLEGSRDWHTPHTINGVVALYGRGIPAAHGARFMKARIVALCRPDPNQDEMRYYAAHLASIRAVEVTEERIAEVRRNYAGIPFYDTFAEMLAHHPTTPPKEES